MLENMPPALELGLDFMDRDHADFLDQVRRGLILAAEAQDGGASAMTTLLAEILTHTEHHFGREEEAMREYGFPAQAIHRNEHERVLERMSEILKHWQATHDWRFVTDTLDGEVLPWFHQHLRTMDAATAAFILQQRDLEGAG